MAKPATGTESVASGQEGAEARLKTALKDYAETTYRDFSRFRFAEEREWYECALFYQRRQWLSWSQGEKRWKPITQNKRQPKPMPVSNYFALTINANANQLAANLPRMQVSATSDADADQRAADMAEKAIPAINKESGMLDLNPLLAKHTCLWGMGITKDIFDASRSTGRTSIPQVTLAKVPTRYCNGCGNSYDVPVDQAAQLFTEPPPAKDQSAMDQLTAPEGEPAAGAQDELQAPTNDVDGEASVAEACPKCGSGDLDQGERSEPKVEQVMSFTRGKITTEVRPVFELYLPRNCQNPNLARRVCQRYRMMLGEARRLFPDAAKDLQAEQSTEVHEIYLEALRSLVSYSYMHEQSVQAATITEVWMEWDELTKEVQEEIESFYADDAEKLENWQELGGYVIVAGGKVMDYGSNPLDGKTPYTFYLWEVDPANVYPKGLGVDLVPLQKRLNRIDSLMELGMMCNSAGKWLWPKTQTTEPPSGSPNEVAEYDVIGDGKIAPTFVQPSPFHDAVWRMRQAILADFQQLGMTLPASKGEAPSDVTSFRGLAYLGAKADEAINTQRALYERGHQLRCEKTLSMARKWWDEPRLGKVAGPNGNYMVRCFSKEDLSGNYELDFIPGSSKPRSLEEKQAAFQGLMQGGFIDPKDPTTRQFVLDLSNLPEVGLTDERQYLKAERDLERAKQGIAPAPNPNIKFDVFLKVFVDFSLTEEFDELPPPAQQTILMAAQGWSRKLQEIQQQMQQAKPPSETIAAKFELLPDWAQLQVLAAWGVKPPAAAGPVPGPGVIAAPGRGAAPGAQPAAPSGPGNPLNGVPGQTVSPAAAEAAALKAGGAMAGAVH